MEKMKILQVSKLYYPEVGGIEKTLQQISEGLNDITDLKVLVCQKKGRGCMENVNKVEICRSGSFGVIQSVPVSVSFLWNLRKLVNDMDVVQFHMPFPLGDIGCLLSGYGGKVVAFWHSDVIKQKKWMFLYGPIMKRFLSRADLILVGSKGILEGSVYLKPYKDKCRVVPFAVRRDIEEAGGEWIKLHGYKEKEKGLHFLFIGRLVYYKGCNILLEAFSEISSDAVLTIVGDGILKEKLMAQSERYGLSERICFLGHIDDLTLKKCLEDADVFVLPSVERSEAFGLVQLEAMAYGIPVINTNLPSGVPEVSIHMKTGLTVKPGNVRDLLNAMNWMCCHPNERKEMGIEARKRLESRFTEKLLVKNLHKIYKDLCESER